MSGNSEENIQEKKKILEPSIQEKQGLKGAADAALIADLQLGQIEEVYTLNRSFRVFMIFLVLVSFFLFSFGIWYFTPRFGFPSSLVWSFSLILVPLILCFLVRHQYGGMRFYICAHGLLYLQHKKRESIRWDEVRRACWYHGGGRGN